MNQQSTVCFMIIIAVSCLLGYSLKDDTDSKEVERVLVSVQVVSEPCSTVPKPPTQILLTLDDTDPSTRLIATWIKSQDNAVGVSHVLYLDPDTASVGGVTVDDDENCSTDETTTEERCSVAPDSYTFTKLMPGQRYTLLVTAKVKDQSQFSEVFSNPVYTIPRPPTCGTVSRDSSDKSRKLTAIWSKPPDNAPGVLYKLRLEPDSEDLGDTTVKSHTNYTFSGLKPGEQYNIYVWAESDVKAKSSEARCPLEYTVPLSPIKPMLERDKRNPNTNLIATWTEPSDNAEHVSYVVRLDPDTIGSGELITNGHGVHIFTGLIPGQEYTVYVMAKVDNTVRSDEVRSNSVYTVPMAPSHTRLMTVSLNTQLEAYWTEAPKNAQSTVYITNLDPDTANIGEIRADAEGTCKFSGLIAGEKYILHVRAEVGEAVRSSEAVSSPQYTVPDPPSKPVLLRDSSNANTNLIATWTEPSNNAASVAYFVQLVPDTPNTGEVQASQKGTHTFTGLTPGEKYQFSILAQANSESRSSIIESTAVYTVPKAPSNPTLMTDSSSGRPKLIATWVIPADNAKSVTYLARLDPDSKTLGEVTAVKSDTLTFIHLIPGTEYTLYMWATAGPTTVSSEVRSAAVLGVPHSPENPVLCTDSVDPCTRLKATWTEPKANPDGIYYKLHLVPDTSGLGEVLGMEKEIHIFTGLIPGMQYSLHVRAEVGKTSRSMEVASSPKYTIPRMPTNIGLFRDPLDSSTTLIAKWFEPSDNAPSVSYVLRLEPDTDNVGLVIAPRSEPHTFTQLRPGEKYVFYVRAHADVDSESPEARSSVTYTVPKPPVNPRLTRDFKNPCTKLIATWQEPEANAARVSYILHLEPDQGTGEIKAEKRGTLVFTDLIAGERYTFFVRAGSDVSAVSAEVESTTEYTELKTPTKPVLTPDVIDPSTRLIATWNEPTDNAPGVYYLIHLDPDTAEEGEVIAVDRGKHTFNNLVPGEQYTLKIRATTKKHTRKRTELCV